MTGHPLIFRPQPPRGDTFSLLPCIRPLPIRPLVFLRPWFPALAPQWLNLGFASRHSPFIPPARNRRNPWLAALAAKNIPAILDTSRPYDVIWVPREHAQKACTELNA